jgi:hypothetical protein
MSIRTDRRICFTADRSEMVEETDPRAAYLAYPAGRHVSPGDAEKYGLSEQDGRVVLSGKVVPAKAKPSEAPEPAEPQAPSEAPEWTLSTSPEDYLERYGDDAPNSALARAVIEAAEG